jgi:Na+-driven multidrug efflux pump
MLSHWLLGLFITLPEVLAQAEHLLHIMLWSMLLFGFGLLGTCLRARSANLRPHQMSPSRI